MLSQLTKEELQQQLNAAMAGLTIGLAATEFELHQELSRRKQRPIIQDEQEDIEKAKGWYYANTEQGF
mgnify:FL=1